MEPNEKTFRSDQTIRSCPHGSSVDYPVGTVRHVKINDVNCKQCPCYGGCSNEGTADEQITCCYPYFAEQMIEPKI